MDPLSFNQKVLGSSPSALTTSNPYTGKGLTAFLSLQARGIFSLG